MPLGLYNVQNPSPIYCEVESKLFLKYYLSIYNELFVPGKGNPQFLQKLKNKSST